MRFGRRGYSAKGRGGFVDPERSLRASRTSVEANAMGTGPFRKRRECRARAEAKLALARALIVEADQRWHGLARFLEQSGLDQNAELVGRLARQAKDERFRAAARAGRG
jgi:hypothetical protein